MEGQPSGRFVSCSQQDPPFVLQPPGDVRVAGAPVWVDQLTIVAGKRSDEADERALRTCPGVVIALPPGAIASPSFMDEVS